MSIYKAFTARVQKLLYDAEVATPVSNFIDDVLLACLALAALSGSLAWYLKMPFIVYLVILLALLGLPLCVVAILVMRADKRTANIENMLPSFLSMMASNIRSGVTYDRALLLSSRKEFGPLSREIDRAAKQAIAGKPLADALMEMAKRTRSETFAKTMRLIVEGMNAGGNLAEMLEMTAIDIRMSSSLKKEVSATVLVYRLFIILAATIGAPLLYALTGFLIDVFTGIRSTSGLDAAGASAANSQMPMFSGGEAISPGLFSIYAILAIAITVLLSTLASGVITKGKESEGLPDLPWTIALAFGIFFGVQFIFSFLLKQIVA
ncbi:MAG: type II secretion system F family protein [Candidatus Micrarchaeota archaeon]|nr:type II secretion system F family protein [Candidatus Micrarchaeota archaeon]